MSYALGVMQVILSPAEAFTVFKHFRIYNFENLESSYAQKSVTANTLISFICES